MLRTNQWNASGRDLSLIPTEDFSSEGHLGSLQRRLRDTLRRAVPDRSRVAYVDIPVHKNVGDLLIYLGTKIWIEQAKLDVLGIWSLKQFRFPKLPDETIIVAHGGGNLGDLYPEHERLRHDLVKTYRKHRIVILPQTVHFADAEAQARSLDAYLSHDDCYVMCRDHVSLATVQEAIGDRALLAPDMATLLYPLRSRLGLDRTPEGRGALYLMRTDGERASGQSAPSLAEADATGDWNELLGVPLRLASRVMIDLDAWARPSIVRDRFERAWERLAWRMVARCAVRMTRYRRIVTSRLHGHIMAVLLDLPNEIHDNFYGKNGRYFNAWHRELRTSCLVGQTAEAARRSVA